MKPSTLDSTQYERIEQAIRYITENVNKQPSLLEIADEANMSPFHFQRVFTEWAGISPKKFLQFLTTDALRAKLRETASIEEAADAVGLSGQSRVYDLFTSIEAVTPGEYKSGGKDLKISFGYHPTPYGECFLAITEKGICAMAFINTSERETELTNFKNKWHFATLHHDQQLTREYIDRIFGTHTGSLPPLHLLVQGTNFQVKVWEALLSIPEGALTTYKHIAETIGNPKAVRAVGTAVGDNPIAYLIPCHRVIRSEGKLGEYRWGSNRKKLMVGWEASRKDGSTAKPRSIIVSDPDLPAARDRDK